MHRIFRLQRWDHNRRRQIQQRGRPQCPPPLVPHIQMRCVAVVGIVMSRAIIGVPALNLERFSATLVANPVSIRGVVADAPDPGRETSKGG